MYINTLCVILALNLLVKGMDIEFIDTTLRDGEQAPGISFNNKQKINIVNKLIELGITEIEAGIPRMGETEFGFVKSLSKYSSLVRISAWSRFNIDDVKQAYETGVNTIHISIPVSGYHLPYQLGLWSNVLEKLDNILNYSKLHFKNVSIGIQDSFRSEHSRIIDICNIAEKI